MGTRVQTRQKPQLGRRQQYGSHFAAGGGRRNDLGYGRFAALDQTLRHRQDNQHRDASCAHGLPSHGRWDSSFGLGIGCSAGWYGYTGGLLGYNTANWYFPADDVTVVAWVSTQNNNPHPGVANAVIRDIARIMTPAHIPFLRKAGSGSASSGYEGLPAGWSSLPTQLDHGSSGGTNDGAWFKKNYTNRTTRC